MLWRSAEGYVKHWFALIGAMLSVALRAPVGSLLRDTWLYRPVKVVPYEFGLSGGLITSMTLLLTIYLSLSWMDYKKKLVQRDT